MLVLSPLVRTAFALPFGQQLYIYCLRIAAVPACCIYAHPVVNFPFSSPNPRPSVRPPPPLCQALQVWPAAECGGGELQHARRRMLVPAGGRPSRHDSALGGRQLSRQLSRQRRRRH